MTVRTLRLFLLTALLAAGLVVTVGSGPALACSCASGEMSEHVGWADDIVVGMLVDLHEPRSLLVGSDDPVTYVVEVHSVLKGDAGHRVVFESARSGASCGLEGMVVDRRYLFFLHHEGDTRDASLCGGTAPASATLLAEVEAVTGPASPPRGEDDPLPDNDLTGWLMGAGATGIALVAGVALWLLRRVRSAA